MAEYTLITNNIKIFKGDFIKYTNEWGENIGYGVLVKKVIDPIKPLTESFYILKNINTNKYWKVKCNRYKFFKKSRNSYDSDIRSLFYSNSLFQNVKNNLEKNN